MTGYTFSDRVRSRWWVSIIMFVVGFAVSQFLVWVMMSFIVFVAVQITMADQRKLLMTVVQILVAAVYLWSWAVRGIQLVSIDTILKDAGPLERAVIKQRIEQEGINLVEMTGGPE